jgi:hypothetical protein
MSIPAKNAFSRVFLIERRARGDRAPDYHSSLIAGTVEQSFGDLEKIEVPDPDKYGEFQEIGTIRGGEERATTSLTGRYAADLASTLLRLAKIKCASDIQIHFGACQNPNEFNQFDKAIILEDASLTSVSTDELGTLDSGGQAAVNETAEISAKNWYEVLPLKFAERASSLVANEVLDIVIADSIGCGECADESDGCQRVFAITKTAHGSPSTPADLLYSPDSGTTWYSTDIDPLTTGTDPNGVAKIGDYVTVVSNVAESLYYLDVADLAQVVNDTGDPTFVAVATGFVASSGPNDIWSVGSYAFIVGDGGYVYGTSDPTAGVTVLDAGVAVTDNLNAVHAMNSEKAIAGGDLGAVIYTLDGVTWAEVAVRPNAANINCVWMRGEREFWAGTAGGRIFFTIDQGASWTEATFTGSGSGVVHDLAFSTDSVLSVSHATTAPVGRLLRSYDAGNSFRVLPESAGSLDDNDRLTAIAVCKNDVNLLLAAGLGPGGSDGIILRGAD